MAAFVLTTGPCHIYTQNPTNLSYGYLGTCETSPEIEITKAKIPVMNDLASVTPFTYLIGGQEAVCRCVFTRWDPNVAIQALCYDEIATGASIGNETRLTRGSLVNPFRLIFQFSFYGTAVAQSNLPPGYRFHAAFVDNYVGSPVGTTTAAKLGIAFKCINNWNSLTGAFSLFDMDASILTQYTPN